MQEQIFRENGFLPISIQEMQETVGGNFGLYEFFMRVAASFIGAQVLPKVFLGAQAARRTYDLHPEAFVK